jgi:catechol 2,3-dioxygenase-like lactoylglutathione lyase family enzyme
MLNDVKSISGIHHVTAITADAQQNIDFYHGVLGLRLVKLTVNFDDPSSYHLYYGDELGRPGTILTFFAWPGAYRGRIGPPQATSTAFSVPAAAMQFWAERLQEKGVAIETIIQRFGEQVLRFSDPDGMNLEIIGTTETPGNAWAAGPIPARHAIRGFHGVTLSEEGYEKTAQLLTEVMGYTLINSEQNRFRYRAGPGDGLASTVDLLCVPDGRHGTLGAGVVHHVAVRATDAAEQIGWRNRVVAEGLNVSPVMDRVYFQSIYYREPGGVLFEIATDEPGFTFDEAPEKLGKKLMLPPWLEKNRAAIEAAVPPVCLP